MDLCDMADCPQRPSTILLPLLVLVIALAGGLTGVLWAAENEQATKLRMVRGLVSPEMTLCCCCCGAGHILSRLLSGRSTMIVKYDAK
jgi:hypothetical protein